MKYKPFSDEEYGIILDNIVAACVDTAVTYKGKVLLVKRDHEPAKDSWWIFGGRVIKGESLKQAARRGIDRELNLLIHDEERFVEVGIFNLIWPTRREPESSNGCHHLLIAHQIELTESEKNQLTFLPENTNKYSWHEITNFSSTDFTPELSAILNRLQTASRQRDALARLRTRWLR